MRRMYMLVVVLTLLTGCATAFGDATTSTPTAAAQVREGVLGGDPNLEGGCVWLDTGQQRLEIVWPEGYRATANPIELRDPTGAVVATSGDGLWIQGNMAPDVVSTCQVGETWKADDVRPVR